jgi:hypothetical protein
LGWVILGVMTLWAVAALYLDVSSAWLRLPLAVIYAATMVMFWIGLRRPWKKIFTLAGFALVLTWWLTLKPSNDRDWQPDMAVLPSAEITTNQVTLHNIRNCDYHTETNFVVHYYDETFDLAQLRTVDLYLVTWGSPHIAHTMVSFGFTTGAHICFSIETRKEKGEDYSAVKGLFRQFELSIIAADERDLIRLRTNYRQGEKVNLYRLRMTPEQGRRLLFDYLHRINELHAHAEWYNAVTENCTTALRTERAAADRAPWDWRILFNGHLDELLYEHGLIDTNLPFAQLKQLSHINPQARAADKAVDFSQQIRKGLPGFNE